LKKITIVRVNSGIRHYERDGYKTKEGKTYLGYEEHDGKVNDELVQILDERGNTFIHPTTSGVLRLFFSELEVSGPFRVHIMETRKTLLCSKDRIVEIDQSLDGLDSYGKYKEGCVYILPKHKQNFRVYFSGDHTEMNRELERAVSSVREVVSGERGCSVDGVEINISEEIVLVRQFQPTPMLNPKVKARQNRGKPVATHEKVFVKPAISAIEKEKEEEVKKKILAELRSKLEPRHLALWLKELDNVSRAKTVTMSEGRKVIARSFILMLKERGLSRQPYVSVQAGSFLSLLEDEELLEVVRYDGGVIKRVSVTQKGLEFIEKQLGGKSSPDPVVVPKEEPEVFDNEEDGLYLDDLEDQYDDGGEVEEAPEPTTSTIQQEERLIRLPKNTNGGIAEFCETFVSALEERFTLLEAHAVVSGIQDALFRLIVQKTINSEQKLAKVRKVLLDEAEK
jgi:hypothetical protein